MGIFGMAVLVKNIEVMEDDEAICKGNSEQQLLK